MDCFGTRRKWTGGDRQNSSALPAASQSYERIREQARIQVEGRAQGKLLYEALPIMPGFGLASLPKPSPGDVFFDLEGDPFASEGGLEFLFGYAFIDDAGATVYTADWVLGRAQEKAAFERFVDFVIARWKKYRTTSRRMSRPH